MLHKKSLYILSGICLSFFAVLPNILWSGEPVPGVTYNNSNIEEIKDYVYPTLYQGIKNPTMWNIDKFEFTVAPHVKYEFPKEWIEATEKHSKDVVIDKDDSISNWTAGTPFPNIDINDPQAGLKLAWNNDKKWVGDNHMNYYFWYSMDRRRERQDHLVYSDWNRFIFNGRILMDPKPHFGEGTDDLAYADYCYWFEPPDIKHMGYLLYVYMPKKDDEQWAYIPAMRRVRRLSGAQRTDVLHGTDQFLDDSRVYSGHVARNSYKLIGKKKMCVERLDPRQHPPYVGIGNIFTTGELRQVVDVYIVENTPKDPNYPYSKLIWYIDGENFILTASETYDRKGAQWKYIESGYFTIPHQVSIQSKLNTCDLQRLHGTQIVMDPNKPILENSPEIKVDRFKPSFLLKRAR